MCTFGDAIRTMGYISWTLYWRGNHNKEHTRSHELILLHNIKLITISLVIYFNGVLWTMRCITKKRMTVVCKRWHIRAWVKMAVYVKEAPIEIGLGCIYINATRFSKSLSMKRERNKETKSIQVYLKQIILFVITMKTNKYFVAIVIVLCIVIGTYSIPANHLVRNYSSCISW